MRRIGWIALLFAVGFGCEKKDDAGGSNGAGATVLADLDEIAIDSTGRVLAFSMASAPNAFLQSYLPILTADIALQFGGTCPSKTETGNETVYDGNCTDGDGQEWFGTATLTQGAGGSSIEYDGFGFLTVTSCGGTGYDTSSLWSGSFEMGGTPSPTGEGTFSTDLRVDIVGLDEDDCSTSTSAWAFDYSGTFAPGPDGDGDTEPDAQINSGEGRFGILMVSGDPSLEGRVDAETTDEVVVTTLTSDTSFTLCQSEALSGTTTLEAGGHSAEITYDGDTDCDAEPTVTWTLDGAAHGELAGVGCSVALPARRVSGAALVLAALAVLAPIARRRR